MIKALLLIILGVVLAACLLPSLLRLNLTSKQQYNVPEALGILGLNSTATREQIIKAHRNKMRIHHPDLGGSQFMAAQINWAKDTLLQNFTYLTL